MFICNCIDKGFDKFTVSVIDFALFHPPSILTGWKVSVVLPMESFAQDAMLVLNW